jgi:nucleoside-diphosphate-sugar epimerase
MDNNTQLTSIDKDPVSFVRIQAEKEALNLAQQYNLNLCVINSGLFVGPLLSKRTEGASIEYVKAFFEGKDLKQVWPLVDVRDVANAHWKAATTFVSLNSVLMWCNMLHCTRLIMWFYSG